MEIFPVDASGHPYYADAYNPLPGGHHGTDIFAPRGTPVLAVDGGNVRREQSTKGGLCIYLTTSRGDRYYYAHLDSVVGSFPRVVTAGEVIGKVGNSGNAQGKATHVHFQVWMPGGIGLVDPYPSLKAARMLNTTEPSSSSSSSAPEPEPFPHMGIGLSGTGWLVLLLLAAWGGYEMFKGNR